VLKKERWLKMPFNPSPQVAAARDFAKKFGANRVVINFTLPDGRYGYASYGATEKLCSEAKKIADKNYHIFGAIVTEVESEGK
jgi:hypothetical protein